MLEDLRSILVPSVGADRLDGIRQVRRRRHHRRVLLLAGSTAVTVGGLAVAVVISDQQAGRPRAVLGTMTSAHQPLADLLIAGRFGDAQAQVAVASRVQLNQAALRQAWKKASAVIGPGATVERRWHSTDGATGSYDLVEVRGPAAGDLVKVRSRFDATMLSAVSEKDLRDGSEVLPRQGAGLTQALRITSTTDGRQVVTYYLLTPSGVRRLVVTVNPSGTVAGLLLKLL